ncbi:hypothetical protein D9619_006123 [Psilocybe cf. subviscida]|uniref:Uncharacterized protein n=1 Tax=Psilocybe cf. subviscida TaxID=2480587 RepID=A0A8H5B518_9AGAR|nr:hypothetical protein D9619_006123 [Psilocybe cf. subviscida]
MSLVASGSTIATSGPSGSPEQDRVVLILCGLIASGKVRFFFPECQDNSDNGTALVPPRFVHDLNLDDARFGKPRNSPHLLHHISICPFSHPFIPVSTFAEALQHHYPHFHRCNQDDLGDRRAVEQLARECLQDGLSVCVDRTNFNAAQRAYWIDIAREFPGTKVWVIVFDTPYDVGDISLGLISKWSIIILYFQVPSSDIDFDFLHLDIPDIPVLPLPNIAQTCVARLKTRTSHPTIKSPAEGLAVLARFAADFQAPRPHEGYERILFLQPADHPAAEYTAADIKAILKRVRNAPPIVPVPPPQSGRGGRGGGYGQGYGHTNRPGYGYGGSGYRDGTSGSSSFRGGNGNSRGHGGHHNPYQQQNNGRGRGGASYRGAYRGDGVGLYGGRPFQSPPAQASESGGRPAQMTPGGGGGVGPVKGHPREDVFPIDD